MAPVTGSGFPPFSESESPLPASPGDGPPEHVLVEQVTRAPVLKGPLPSVPAPFALPHVGQGLVDRGRDFIVVRAALLGTLVVKT